MKYKVNNTNLLKKNNSRGMTLMEVLVAVTILSCITLALLSGTRAATRATDVADVIVHFEEVENYVIPRFQEDPTMQDLGPIMPKGYVKIDNDNYEVYYTSRLQSTPDESDAAYKITFEREIFHDEADGFNIESKEYVLRMDVYQNGTDSSWSPFSPSMSQGTHGVGTLSVATAPSIPGGGTAAVGSLTVEVIGGTMTYNGDPKGTRYEMSGIVPGHTLSDYMDAFAFIPDNDSDESTLMYEIKDDDAEGGWELIQSFDIPAGLNNVIRVTYDKYKDLDLIFRVSNHLDRLSREVGIEVNVVPFMGVHDELNLESMAVLTQVRSYDTLFKSQITTPESGTIPLDYKTVEWVETLTGDTITYDDLIDGVSLYTEESRYTSNPVIDRDRFQGKIFVATPRDLPLPHYNVNLRIVGFPYSDYLPNGTLSFVIPTVSKGETVTVTDITRAIFMDESITDFREVPETGSVDIKEYSGSFSGPEIPGIEHELESGGISIDNNRYIEITYNPEYIHMPIMLDEGDGVLIDTEKTLSIRTDYQSSITRLKISQALGKEVSTYYGSDYKWEGAFIDNEQRLNTPVTSVDQDSTIVMKYRNIAERPLYVDIKVSGDDIPEALTDASIVDLSFVPYSSFGTFADGTRLKFNMPARTLQASPLVATTPETFTLPFEFSINGDAYYQGDRIMPHVFGDQIYQTYLRGNYTHVEIRFETDYPYVDVSSFINDMFLHVGTETSTSTISTDSVREIFYGQGATFKPEQGEKWEQVDGGFTYFGEHADLELIALDPDLDGIDFKFRSEAKPNLQSDISTNTYGKNITLLWDTRGMDSIATNLKDATNPMYRGTVGLIPQGGDKYRFSYMQNGIELMTEDNIIHIPGGVDALDKVTLIINRVHTESPFNADGVYNYYGAWTPLFGAPRLPNSPQQAPGTDGSTIHHTYNAKYSYKDVFLSPSSIPIRDLDVVFGNCYLYIDEATGFEPGQPFANPEILNVAEHGGRLLSESSDMLIHDVHDLPIAPVSFRTSLGAPVIGDPAGVILGATLSPEEQNQVVSVPFDYTDLTPSFEVSVDVAGGLTFQ